VRDVAFELLWVVPLAPVVIALLALPVGGRAPRGFSAAALVISWLLSATAAGFAVYEQLLAGRWFVPTPRGFYGARLVAWGPFGEIRLAAGPLELVLCAALAAGAGLVVVGSLAAWGGGPRASARPLTGPQLAGVAMGYGAAQVAVLSSSLSWLLGGCALASVCGWGLLSAAHPKRSERDAAGAWFVLQRVGDGCWLVALALLTATFGTLELDALADTMRAVPAWERAASGALAGFPARSVVSLAALLLLLGVASRAPTLPAPLLYRGATGMPAPSLGLVHGLLSFFLAVVVVVRTAALWSGAKEVVAVAVVLTALTAFVVALAALNARDVLRIDLHLLHVIAALALLAALLGQLPGAVLLAVCLAILAPVLLSTTGAVLEALPGRLDPFDMGGLYRSLRWSDRARALAIATVAGTPFLGVWLGLERALYEGWVGPRASAAAVVLAGLALVPLSLAAFRSLHLVFSGDAPREDAPAVLVEVPAWRWAPSLLAALALFAGALPLALPLEIAWEVRPDRAEPFLAFLLPSLNVLLDGGVTVVGTVVDEARPSDPTGRWWLMGALGALPLLGFAASWLLYRKGPTALHDRFAALPLVKFVGPVASTGLGSERVLVEGGSSLLSQIARVVVSFVLDVVLDTLITRLVALAGTLARALLRLVHNGDVQRTVLFTVLVIASALWLWGRT
jgi:NADH:ubiquinone oxidoreductase subunit 5 (subunit L)/multisubunit Na+/H+ antiporter MnhA subunit